jgi:Flp pilus assembly pilin Flp
MVRTMGTDRIAPAQTVVPLPATRGSRIRRALRWLCHDSAAVTSVEYAVMLALILGVILISVKLLGTNTKALWTNNSSTLQGAGLGS